jgi:hypothetical protein
MPVKPPEGFLTRPEAAKVFNRSRRALERDLDLALSMQDLNVLEHWCLATKDGEIRCASKVDTDEVKQLVTDGMTPAWCIDENWLEREYGRKGESKAANSQETEPLSLRSAQQVQDSEQPANSVLASTQESLLQSEITFMRERIKALEREKQEESARSENRESRLFEQLAVKDEQIHSWDELTQGLTRGLATGQLIPSLLSGRTETAPDRTVANSTESESPSVSNATIVEPHPRSKKKPPKKKRPSTAKPKRKRSKSAFEKYTPTFHKLASGLFRRS